MKYDMGAIIYMQLAQKRKPSPDKGEGCRYDGFS
jgi:hypothetical protein